MLDVGRWHSQALYAAIKIHTLESSSLCKLKGVNCKLLITNV